jgi:hypothetical protein
LRVAAAGDRGATGAPGKGHHRGECGRR